MDLVDVLLLGCGIDNDMLETIMDTIVFIEDDTDNPDTASDLPAEIM